jgi:hypothetical protein
MLIGSSLVAATSATAEPLPCVQRAVDWNAASSFNHVTFALTALHETGEGAYLAGGATVNNRCSGPTYYGTVDCLNSYQPRNAVLLHPWLLTQNPNDVLLLRATFPSDSMAQVYIRQAHAIYEFEPACVGNMVVGDDQFGNHWTVAFTLGQSPIIH